MKQAILFFLLILPCWAHAQGDTTRWVPVTPAQYSFINYEDNMISRPGKLDSFLKKLQAIKQTRQGKVTIIHIGDSHMQADMISEVLRNGFQDFFGDAGRGLVFPYQVANTNAPHDIASSGAGSWKSNKITNQSSDLRTGITGYGIHSSAKDAAINIHLKDIEGRQAHFNQMTFFMGGNNASYKITDSSIANPLLFNTLTGTDRTTITTDSLITGFSLVATGDQLLADYSFYGVSLEKKDAHGVLYDAIGVNGARLDQYLVNDLFWQQLQTLNGDLFIVSLGTNEAQTPHINEQALLLTCDSFLHRVHRIAPKATILFTTPEGSFYKMKKPNAALSEVTDAFIKFCDTRGLPLWDLYHISGGKISAAAFKKHDLMSHDLVHYNAQGYQLQGQLLLCAFAKAYTTYDHLHPYKPELPKVSVPAKIKTSIKEPGKLPANKTPATKPDTAQPTAEKKPAISFPDSSQSPHRSNIQVDYSN